MKWQVAGFILALILLPVLFYGNSCGAPKGLGSLNGTSTGNPYAGTDPNGSMPATAQPSPSAAVTASFQISNAICGKLSTCFSNTDDLSSCADRILLVAVGGELGIATGSQLSFAELSDLEVAQAVFVNTSAVSKCLAAINVLSCTDASVTNAYVGQSLSPFAGVPEMIPQNPGGCGSVYQSQ